MSLTEEVLAKRAKHKKELEQEVYVDGDVIDDIEEGPREEIKRAKSRAPKKSQTRKVNGRTTGGEWGVICRLSESYCSIMESAQVSRRLEEETLNEVVESSLVLFRYLCGKHMDEADE